MSAGNVLMVCLGNICRSPLAHGIFEQLSSNFDIRVDSAGTANYHSGNSPDRRSQATALQHGIDISQQRARQFTVTILMPLTLSMSWIAATLSMCFHF